MKCVQAASFDDIERYLTGQFSDEEQQVFEEHYFGCAECFARLEEMRAIQTAARSVKPGRRTSWWLPGLVAVAATIAVAVGLWLWRSQPKPVPQIARTPAATQPVLVAKFEAPSWKAVTLRGAADQPSLRPAMTAYQHADYASAASQLEAIVAKQPSRTEARFYLGISRILSDDRATGISELRRVIADGDTPWLEPAHFYLAKAMLMNGNVSGARAQLEQVIPIHGDFAKEARELLNKLPKN